MRAGCRCENVVFVTMSVCFFVSSLSRSEAGMLIVRGVHSLNKHCVAVYRPILMWFSDFFQKGLLFQVQCIVLIFVTRWCHKFHEIT